MRPIERLTRGRKHNLSFGGSGGFDVGPFWRFERAEDEALSHDFPHHQQGFQLILLIQNIPILYFHQNKKMYRFHLYLLHLASPHLR